VLNALLGAGTALAPIFVAIFVGLGFWWGLPVLSAFAAEVPVPASDGERVLRFHETCRLAIQE